MARPQPLTYEEINDFWDELDLNSDGKLTFDELEHKLYDVLDELAPDPRKEHPAQKDGTEKGKPPRMGDLHRFLRTLMPESSGLAMDRDQFARQIQGLNIPSQKQTSSADDTKEAKEYEKHMTWKRWLAAWWSVRGPEVAFLFFVFALTAAIASWQFEKYLTSTVDRNALGWGIVVAKFAAGALYPLFFFLILSMSRWFATLCRRSRMVSRFVNWDLSQSFHIRISCVALFFSILHAIGHMTGSFVWGSRSSNQPAVAVLLGSKDTGPMSYSDWVKTRAGWSGLTALICFLLIAIASTPRLRRKSYEAFQITHLLMYLMFAMLAIHGSRALVTAPMMGYWLVLPVLLVLCERLTRLARTFTSYPARVESLDSGTVIVTIEKPQGQTWGARAGQYIFLQVPSIARFQWHPFTISACIGNRLQVHIKADGNWTSQLHVLIWMAELNLGEDGFARLNVGLDGPYGAPAERFYTFDKSLIIGAGIGVTPFAACLTDLAENYQSRGDPWRLTPLRFFRKLGKPPNPTVSHQDPPLAPVIPETTLHKRGDSGKTEEVQKLEHAKAGSYNVRRVDFHWTVKERNQLLWFSELLNRASTLADQDDSNLTLNIHAHITAKPKHLSTHIFRYLLNSYRTDEFPFSALTGLSASSSFGRPDFPVILEKYYTDMRTQGWTGRVGVFFCGTPVIGQALADMCSQLTQRARAEGSTLRFIFINEVFG